MPCGGIWPTKSDPKDICFYCGKFILDSPASWCEEWDTPLHDSCIDAFLKTEEGEIVLSHGHQVIRRP